LPHDFLKMECFVLAHFKYPKNRGTF